jgi:hypothetical protein
LRHITSSLIVLISLSSATLFAEQKDVRELVAAHLFDAGKSEEKVLELKDSLNIKIPLALEVIEGSGRNAQATLVFQTKDSKKTSCSYAGPKGEYFVRIRHVIDKLLTAAAGVNPWADALINPDLTLARQNCAGVAAKSDRADAETVTLRILATRHHIFTSKTLKVRARLEALPSKISLPPAEPPAQPTPKKP